MYRERKERDNDELKDGGALNENAVLRVRKTARRVELARTRSAANRATAMAGLVRRGSSGCRAYTELFRDRVEHIDTMVG